jgi:hypothetical protein
MKIFMDIQQEQSQIRPRFVRYINDHGLSLSPWVNLTWEDSGPQGNLFILAPCGCAFISRAYFVDKMKPIDGTFLGILTEFRFSPVYMFSELVQFLALHRYFGLLLLAIFLPPQDGLQSVLGLLYFSR